MRMNKEKFLKTEFGAELKATIEALMFYINEQSKISRYGDPDEFGRLQKDIDKLFTQWSVYQLAVKQFYGIQYHFTLTDEYFAVVNSDETDWLFKSTRGGSERQ